MAIPKDAKNKEASLGAPENALPPLTSGFGARARRIDSKRMLQKLARASMVRARI